MVDAPTAIDLEDHDVLLESLLLRMVELAIRLPPVMGHFFQLVGRNPDRQTPPDRKERLRQKMDARGDNLRPRPTRGI